MPKRSRFWRPAELFGEGGVQKEISDKEKKKRNKARSVASGTRKKNALLVKQKRAKGKTKRPEKS